MVAVAQLDVVCEQLQLTDQEASKNIRKYRQLTAGSKSTAVVAGHAARLMLWQAAAQRQYVYG